MRSTPVPQNRLSLCSEPSRHGRAPAPLNGVLTQVGKIPPLHAPTARLPSNGSKSPAPSSQPCCPDCYHPPVPRGGKYSFTGLSLLHLALLAFGADHCLQGALSSALGDGPPPLWPPAMEAPAPAAGFQVWPPKRLQMLHTPLTDKSSPLERTPTCVGSFLFTVHEPPWSPAPLSPTFSQPGSSPHLLGFEEPCRPSLEIRTEYLGQSTPQTQCRYLPSPRPPR